MPYVSSSRKNNFDNVSSLYPTSETFNPAITCRSAQVVRHAPNLTSSLVSSRRSLHAMLDSNIQRAGTERIKHTKMTGGTAPSGQASLPTANSTKSFWHSDPSKILIGHRTTGSLPTEADVVIIGSGISGASAAHFLRQDDRGKDLNVVMLEAREACWGATGRVIIISSMEQFFKRLKSLEWGPLRPRRIFYSSRCKRV